MTSKEEEFRNHKDDDEEEEEQQQEIVVLSASALQNDVEMVLRRHYLDQIVQLITAYPPVLVIDADKLGVEYYVHMKKDPSEFLDALRGATIAIFKEVHPTLDYENDKAILHEIAVEVRGYEIQHTFSIADLDQYIHVEGSIVGLEPAGLTNVRFKAKCNECNYDGINELRPLSKCPKCGQRDLTPVYDTESVKDHRFITIGIMPDKAYGMGSAEDTATTKYLLVELAGHLARRQDLVYGLNVSIHGRLRADESTSKKSPLKSKQSQIFYLEANCLEAIDDTRLRSIDKLEITDADLAVMESFKKGINNDRMLVEVLTRSLAPNIIGEEIHPVKECILYQLVAGFDPQRPLTSIYEADEYHDMRGFINMVICSNPDEGKTSVCLAATRISGGVYAEGSGMRPGGMGGGINNDANTGRKMFDDGIATKGHNRNKFFDEVSRLKSEFRDSILNQLGSIMESGFHTVNAVGAKMTLPTQGPWTLALNPKYEVYDPSLGVVENINLPAAIMSRTDMCWLVRTNASDKDLARKKRKNIGRMLLSKKSERKKMAEIISQSENMQMVDSEFLSKWVKHARTIDISADVDNDPRNQKQLDALLDFFDKMEATVKQSGLSLGNRQFAGVLRVMCGRARLCHRDHFTDDDVERVKELFTEMWRRIGFNLDALSSGRTDREYKEMSQEHAFIQLVRELSKGDLYNAEYTVIGLAEEMVKTGKWNDVLKAEQFVKDKIRVGFFYMAQYGHYKVAQIEGYFT